MIVESLSLLKTITQGAEHSKPHSGSNQINMEGFQKSREGGVNSIKSIHICRHLSISSKNSFASKLHKDL